jgi:hypothetical protein
VKNLDHALNYLHRGFSVIPVGKIKKPFVKWEEFQKRRATDDEVKSWWSRWPDANIGIVTGAISGLSVIDIDSEAAADTLSSILPDTIETPICSTPRGGKHLYFEYNELLPTTSNLGNIKGLDSRGDGGYIIAPPSVNGNGKGYSWVVSPDNCSISPLSSVLLYNNLFSLYKRQHDNTANPTTPEQHSTTNDNISFSEPGRDEALFHLANHLVKGRMPSTNIEQYLRFFASHCKPPYPESEAYVKIQSAMKRARERSVNITNEVRDWILTTKGNFSTTMVYNGLQSTTREEKKTILVILGRLEKDGLIQKTGKRAGEYRYIDDTLEEIDYLGAVESPLDLQLPLGLHEMVELMPGNIILIAGEPNAGKTSWLFNFIKLNMHAQEIHYFNSEMSKEELRKRLLKIEDVKITDWKWKVYERSDEFADVIKPGRGKINIIDYLEIYSDFWEIGRFIADIHRRLDGALAVIAIQKNPNVNVGLGGFRTLEKPRLALAMSHGRIDIVKAKNWKVAENPNGKYCEFKIIQGGHMYATSSWLKEGKK